MAETLISSTLSDKVVYSDRTSKLTKSASLCYYTEPRARPLLTQGHFNLTMPKSAVPLLCAAVESDKRVEVRELSHS